MIYIQQREEGSFVRRLTPLELLALQGKWAMIKWHDYVCAKIETTVIKGGQAAREANDREQTQQER